MNKYIKILFIILIISIIISIIIINSNSSKNSSYNIPKEIDLSTDINIYYENEESIKEIIKFYEEYTLIYTQFIENEDENIYKQYKEYMNKYKDIYKQYKYLEQIQSVPDGFMLIYKGTYILVSKKSPEELNNIFRGLEDFDFQFMFWEKEIDGNKIHFIEEPKQNNKESQQYIYHRVDLEQVDNNIYVYKIQ